MQSTTRPAISRAYLVCATPRSGSTLLCQMLAATGVAGRPEEFFEAIAETGEPRHARAWFGEVAGVELAHVPHEVPRGPDYSTLSDVADYEEHLRRSLATGTTPNGVFGAKVMWGHLDEAARMAGDRDADALLVRLLGDVPVRHVWVRRFDTARQAVSLWKAIQTGSWRKGDGPDDRQPRYDFAAIDHLVRMLRAHDAEWERWFARRGIEPLTFRYRHIAADPLAATTAVLAHVGVEEIAAPPEPPLEPQADERNERWVERYNDEAGEPQEAAS